MTTHPTTATPDPQRPGRVVVPCPPGHIEYGSRQLADNAVELHALANPECVGVHAWRCGDHHHIGHPSRAAGDECKRLDAQRYAERQARR